MRSSRRFLGPLAAMSRVTRKFSWEESKEPVKTILWSGPETVKVKLDWGGVKQKY